MGDSLTPLTASEARHLLVRTGFGALPRDVTRLVGRPRGTAVNHLLSFNPSSFTPRGDLIQERQASWFKYMLTTRRTLQEKLVLFWHDHFATNADKVHDTRFMANQNRLLRRYCKGNFRDLVKEINRDPAMLIFLDTVLN